MSGPQKPLKIIYKSVDSLTPYENNPRLNDDAVPQVAKSIESFGFLVPMVVSADGVVVTGHTRLKAAKMLGMDKVPCICADDLTPEQIKAFRLADNKVSERADWDQDLLAIELDGLGDFEFEMEDFGFTPMDFGDFEMAGDEDDDEDDYIDDDPSRSRKQSNDSDDAIVDDEPEVLISAMPETEAVIQSGDIVELGRHRLRCGDSLLKESYDALMKGVVADLAFTSPPYNAARLSTGRAQDSAKYLHNDDTYSNEEYSKFLNTVADRLLDNSEEALINIGVLKGSKIGIISLLDAHRSNFKDLIYWKKNNPVPAMAKNHISSAVELIIALGRDGSRMFRHDPGIWYGVIEGNWAGNNQYSAVHRATFPLYLPTEVINHLSDENAVILDPFGGTGTTLIACEDTGRTCYMQEIDPAYCDLIVRRYIERIGSSDTVHLFRNGEEVDVKW